MVCDKYDCGGDTGNNRGNYVGGFEEGFEMNSATDFTDCTDKGYFFMAIII